MTYPANIRDDVSIDEPREAVEHMHGVPARFIEVNYLRWGMTLPILSALAALTASGCKPYCTNCPPPKPVVQPGWCTIEGPPPCFCDELKLCPGWCLSDSGVGVAVPCPGWCLIDGSNPHFAPQAVPCDGGAEE
jgi:hypothetical protein